MIGGARPGRGGARYRGTVSTPRDDDALSWGGDDDPTLDVGEKRAPEVRPSDPVQPVSSEPEPLQPAAEPEPLQPAATSASRTPQVPASAVHDAPADAGPADDDHDADADSSAPLGNVGLVGIGMVAATFLLFALGWLLAGLRLRSLGLPIPDVTVIALTAGAVLAPLVWFVAVLVLTRAWRTWQRFLLLIVGIVLLVPWPFLSVGALA